jgi:hypothetical protein
MTENWKCIRNIGAGLLYRVSTISVTRLGRYMEKSIYGLM